MSTIGVFGTIVEYILKNIIINPSIIISITNILQPTLVQVHPFLIFDILHGTYKDI